jgi:hypothetical protein
MLFPFRLTGSFPVCLLLCRLPGHCVEILPQAALLGEGRRRRRDASDSSARGSLEVSFVSKSLSFASCSVNDVCHRPALLPAR